MALALLASVPAAAQFSDSYNFLKAVRDKDVLKAKSFIDKPGSTIVNTREYTSGETALIIATRRRDSPWIAFLLQNSADPNLRDREGNSPLIIAASMGFSDGVRVLISGKAQVDAPNDRGETALIRAVHARDATSARLLLNAGANPDRADNMAGLSARDYAERDAGPTPVGRLLAEAPKKEARRQIGPSL